MNTGRYVLDENNRPVEEPDLLTWAMWFDRLDRRRVAETDLGSGLWVSTVFLGLDHNRSPSAVPLLFETMVFDQRGEQFEEMQDRYATWELAEAGHRRFVKRLEPVAARRRA